MVRKIGNLCFCIAVGASAQALELRVTNTQGIELSSVSVGTPFLVVVSSTASEKPRTMPTIESLDKFQVVSQRLESRMTSVQGHAEQVHQFIYTALAEQPGTYRLGPARIDGTESGTVPLTVVQGQQKQAQYAAPRYELKLKSTTGVVSERIPFVLRFISQDPAIKLVHLETPQAPGVTIGPLSQGTAKTEMQGTALSHIVEYTGYFSGDTPGTVTLPRLRADYSQPSQNTAWSIFSFPGMSERNAVFSDKVIVDIKPLPPTDKQSQGVGHFTKFTASLPGSQLAQGDAALLTLTLEGDYPESIGVPQLKLAPELRSYESASKTSATGKSWDYVIQGLKSGTFTIPAQRLTFFDTVSRHYKTLQTEPLTITYSPSQIKQTAPLRPNVEKQEEKKVQPEERVPVPDLPWPLFLFLCLIPPCVQAVRWLVRCPLSLRLRKRVRRASLLLSARRAIKKSERLQDPSPLYEILKGTLIDYYELPPQSNEDVIAAALQQEGLDEQTIKRWQALVDEVVPYTEYAQAGERAIRPQVYKDIRAWLEQLAQNKMMILLLGLLAMQTMAANPFIEQLLSTTGPFPFVLWQLLFLISWWLLWFSSSNKMRLLVISLGLFCWWGIHAYRHYHPRLIVIADKGILYVGPDRSYPTRGMLPRQSVVALAKKVGAWYYVTSPEGSGWIDSAQVALKREV